MVPEIQVALDIRWEEKTRLQAVRYKFFTMKGQNVEERGTVEDKMSTLALIIGIG